MLRVCILIAVTAFLCRAQSPVADLHIDTNPAHVLNSFDPDAALGSSLDVLSKKDIDQVFTPHVLNESLSAGWGPITYRNNTELRMAAWHWNPNGAWSDPVHKRGYFTGSTDLGEPIRYILAYALPHRGFATSGDRPVTGPHGGDWKSNPYLTSRFTHENDELHPQWVVLDLKTEKRVNAVRIAWANPYATSFRVEYWRGKDALDFDGGPDGNWIALPGGTVTNGRGGVALLRLGQASVQARFLRLWMTRSSGTCDEHGSEDIRNCVGYSVHAFDAGLATAGAPFETAADHAPQDRQPSYTCSSVDPWHAEDDVNATG